MKRIGQNKIAALVALLLVGSILTSVKAKSLAHKTPIIIEDQAYLEDVQEYVDSYFETASLEEAPVSIVKVFDQNGNLVLQGKLGELSDDALKIYRQADFLSTVENTCYYQLNSR
ncbi:MAG: putative proteasome-type protease [Roseivirga sp.]|jgi:predicted proteasome-type protease